MELTKEKRGHTLYRLFIFFFYQRFLSRTLTTHRAAGEGRGSFFIPLYHFHPLTNIQTFICNFAREMTITYFYFYRIFITFYRLFCPKEISLTFVYSLSQCIVYWIQFQNIHAFIYQKTFLHTFFCLFWKSLKAFSVCLSRPYHFKFFKGCLPQIWLGPFLNTLSHIRFFWSRCYSDWIWIFTRYCP